VRPSRRSTRHRGRSWPAKSSGPFKEASHRPPVGLALEIGCVRTWREALPAHDGTS
jgi:hypothetical protein